MERDPGDGKLESYDDQCKPSAQCSEKLGGGMQVQTDANECKSGIKIVQEKKKEKKEGSVRNLVSPSTASTASPLWFSLSENMTEADKTDRSRTKTDKRSKIVSKTQKLEHRLFCCFFFFSGTGTPA